MTKRCPLCGSKCKKQLIGDKAVFRVGCPKCGRFTMTLEAQKAIEGNPDLVCVIRREVRMLTNEGHTPRVDTKMVEAFLDDEGNVLKPNAM